jgi:adenine-specific DNA-methyltransferase
VAIEDVVGAELATASVRNGHQPRRSESIHTIKYMGSKREIIDFVAPTIERHILPGERVMDVMAGTSSVAYSLRQNHPVVANDIQHFSAAIARAVLGTKVPVPASSELIDRLRPHFLRNQHELVQLFADSLEMEGSFLQRRQQGPFTLDDLEDYRAYFAGFPDPVEYTNTIERPGDPLAVELQQMVKERRTELDSFPYVLMSAYFANTYIGLRHAIEIDSYRYAIDQEFPVGDDLRDVLLVALMFATSYCNAGTGHFAQYRDIETPQVLDDVFIYRSRDFLAYFTSKLDELAARLSPAPYDNQVWTLDFREALAPERLDGVSLVYADPPYSFVHYSRFYHLLETLVRYDYPACEFKGRYRHDRHQSPFCIRRQAAGAFEALIQPLAERRIQLVISYSDAPSNMISLDEILALCAKHYPAGFDVRVEYLDYRHTTMGRRGDKHRDVQEALIVCGDRF